MSGGAGSGLSFIADVLHGVNLFDRNAFKQVIEESKGEDEESIVLVTLLYAKFADLYHLTKEEKDDWLSVINSMASIDQKVTSTRQFYAEIIKDSPDPHTYLNFLNFSIDNIDDDNYDVQFLLDQFHTYFDLFGTDFEGSHAISELYLTLIDDIEDIKNHYLSRLHTKHKQIDQTFESYSGFITQNLKDSYEKEMKHAANIYNRTKTEQYELELQYIRDPQKTPTEFWIGILNFIVSSPKKRRDVKQLRPIFENAVHEVNDIEIWKKFLLLSYEYGTNTYVTNFYGFLSRFVKAFPDIPYPYVEFLRNIALDYSRYESIHPRLQNIVNRDLDCEDWKELVTADLKVLFRNGKQPEDSKIQEYLQKCLGIPDNTFHTVERFIVSLYESVGEIEKARSVLQQITEHYPREAENWLISYYFEKKHGDVTTVTRVLKAAINRSEHLDWPERIFEEALRYSLLQGDSYGFFVSKIEKKKQEVLALRSESFESTQIEQSHEIVSKTTTEGSKRPLEAEIILHAEDGVTSKKSRSEKTRDREHLTVAVQNLPQHISEKQIINFFRDCGEIHDINIISTGETNQANLEFKNNNDVLKALTKDFKKLAGNELRVTRLLKSTVWVTNFPPSYTQDKLEQLFTAAGRIISIRFPSLKFNSQRRFCYIEFTTSEAATKAVEDFDSRELEGYKLCVKISDPAAKQSRSGATEEGREVYVSKLDFKRVTADKVKQLFSKYGNVENVHLPLSKKNQQQGKKHDGYGFVIFSSNLEAQAAALELNLVSFEGRVIEVSISKKKSERAFQKEVSALKEYSDSEKAIAIKDLPDTVSADQLRDFFSSVGAVENIVLEPSHKGAIIVFADARDAGNALLKLEGTVLGDYTVEFVTVKDLKTQPSKSKPTSNRLFVPSNVRKRPTLSTRVVTSPTAATAAPSPSTIGTQGIQDDQTTQKPKSNSDFRALLLGKKIADA